MRVKFSVLSEKNEYQILARHNFSDFCKLIIKHIISKRGVLLAILKKAEDRSSLANNAKVGSLLKFLLIRYTEYKIQIQIFT